jgi:processive 1,2-diacylglycerol beta-glucosyltransferase
MIVLGETVNCACIYVDGGKGHYIPAKALAEQFEEMGHTVLLEEFYELMQLVWMGKINKKTWRFMLRHPKLEMRLNSRADSSKSVNSGLRYARRHRNELFKKWVLEKRLDYIVCTHFVPSRIMSELAKENGLSIPVYYYATDVFSSPCSSIAPSLRRYFISTEEGREHIIAKGQPADSVDLCPFPLQKACADSIHMEKAAARRKLGLEEMFTIQLNLGGEGIGTVALINELARRKLAIQVLVLGGLSEKAKSRLMKMEKKLPSCMKLRVVGFVKNVDEYLYASDIVVGRAGINTMVESMYMHRPFLITELVYTVIASAAYFERYKIGWLALEPEKQADIIERSLQDSNFLKDMEYNFSQVPMQYGAPAFARQIVADVHAYREENNLS